MKKSDLLIDDRRGTDYFIDPEAAKDLMGVVQFPHDLRLEVLRAMQERLGPDAMLALFSQFIGMANSVVFNSHDALGEFLIVEADFHPYTVAKGYNFPTLFGALNGIRLTVGVNQEKTCQGCACRLGTLANQSPVTTCDVDYCLEGDDKFWCHEELDDKGMPTKRCIGFQAHLKKRDAA